MTPERMRELLAAVQRGEEVPEDEWQQIVEAAALFGNDPDRNVIDEIIARDRIKQFKYK